MKKLFIGNMRLQTTASDLAELFKPFGQVTSVQVAADRETGRSRGFAFVEMPSDEEAAKAITGLDGKDIGGRTLRVSVAIPRTESGQPHGAGGRQPG